MMSLIEAGCNDLLAVVVGNRAMGTQGVDAEICSIVDVVGYANW
jgi:hypothetical protein